MTSNPRDGLELQAKCNTAVCLLEGAMLLVTRVTTDGPKGNGFGGDVADINRRIMTLQQKLLAAHDAAEGRKKKRRLAPLWSGDPPGSEVT